MIGIFFVWSTVRSARQTHLPFLHLWHPAQCGGHSAWTCRPGCCLQVKKQFSEVASGDRQNIYIIYINLKVDHLRSQTHSRPIEWVNSRKRKGVTSEREKKRSSEREKTVFQCIYRVSTFTSRGRENPKSETFLHLSTVWLREWPRKREERKKERLCYTHGGWIEKKWDQRDGTYFTLMREEDGERVENVCSANKHTKQWSK